MLLSQVKTLNQTNKDGHTPLLCLIWSIPEWEQIDYDTVQLLLDKGAEVNVKGTDGLTALGYAEGCGNQKLVRMLKKAGAR
ncbi:MAG: ankyrin repeat domain-containing protein [Blastocatellia bacterium]|nr:ankyrin repeat domain-containing protein [Blastocatellia bacterium]